jgi:hypothetical protein
MGNVHYIIGGDFNLKLDPENNIKPRTTTVLRDFMTEIGLTDARRGKGGEDAYLEQAYSPALKP